MCHLQHLHIVQCIGHNNFTHQYTALLPINFIYIIYPKPKSDPRITKNPDIYFQPINRAKPKWGTSIEFGSICNERNKMMTLEFKRLDIKLRLEKLIRNWDKRAVSSIDSTFHFGQLQQSCQDV